MPRRSKLTPHPETSARDAGLRYVNDGTPGISRRRSGRGFSYVGPDGRTVRERTTLGRIRSLAIPPAWTDVWICPDAKGHIQATGRDARGRKQYRYHPAWHEVRHETKFGRMLAFSEALPTIRKRIEADLALAGLPRRKVLATVVRLLECTQIRVGNDEYARNNDSYGLTTLRDHHVEISGSTLRFEFKGKSGKLHTVDLADRRLARIVARCQAIPGEDLFQYIDEAGERQTIGSGDVNDYIREIAGDDFSAKDFRTWAGTMLACEALLEIGEARTKKDAKANVLRAIDQVAEQLNNTRAVCRKYYIHPEVLAAYGDGLLGTILEGARRRARGSGLGGLETRVMKLLKQRAA
jgi:DNA topoisomerase-1